MSVKDYFASVLKPILLVTIVAAIVPIVAKNIIPLTLGGAILNIGISLISVGLTVFLIGLTPTERTHILGIVYKFAKKEKALADD